MKQLLIIATLFLFIISCKDIKEQKTTELESQSKQETIQVANEKVDATVFKSKTENKDVQLIDVRTPEEFIDGHLKNAQNINFYDDNFLTLMNNLDKSKPVYLYCRSGGRSGSAAKKLEAQGFTEIYDLKGGFLDWQNNNFEIIK